MKNENRVIEYLNYVNRLYECIVLPFGWVICIDLGKTTIHAIALSMAWMWVWSACIFSHHSKYAEEAACCNAQCMQNKN